jgi:hypothetical protein
MYEKSTITAMIEALHSWLQHRTSSKSNVCPFFVGLAKHQLIVWLGAPSFETGYIRPMTMPREVTIRLKDRPAPFLSFLKPGCALASCWHAPWLLSSTPQATAVKVTPH